MKTKGYTSVTRVTERVGPLADHLVRYRPGAKVVRIYREDYRILEMYPLAAQMHGYELRGPEGIFYRGLQCVPDSDVE